MGTQYHWGGGELYTGFRDGLGDLRWEVGNFRMPPPLHETLDHLKDI